MTLPKFIPQFDTLRGIAVLVVIIFHIAHNWRSGLLEPFISSWGWLGVDLFFVLSGFLITGILLDTKRDASYFRNFYARRILRIWPLYFVLLTIMMFVLPRIAPVLAAPSVATANPRWTYLLFFQNFIPHKVMGPLAVTWSLAVEEQFYLVWPIAVKLLSQRKLKIALMILLPAIPLARLAAVEMGTASSSSVLRMDGLVVGALLALFVRELKCETIRRIGTLAIVPSTVGVVLGLCGPRAMCEWFLYSAVAIAFGSLLCLSLTTNFLPKNRFVRFTGEISYGVYLLHLPAFDIVRSNRIRDLLPKNDLANDFLFTALAFALTYTMALISWGVIERPVLRLKRYFEHTARIESTCDNRVPLHVTG